MNIKLIAYFSVLAATAWFFYDYGVTSAEHASQIKQNQLWDKVEAKQNEAFTLAVTLANQTNKIDIRYRTIEKEVIKYAKTHADKQCIANDNDWLHIRADAVRAHNRAIGIQQPAPVPDDSAKTTGSNKPYQQDAEVLAEDVYNIKTCAETAHKLLSLQEWIRAQINTTQTN